MPSEDTATAHRHVFAHHANDMIAFARTFCRCRDVPAAERLAAVSALIRRLEDVVRVEVELV